MDSDLLYALCALATVGLPLGMAWLIVVLGEATRKRRGRQHDQ